MRKVGELTSFKIGLPSKTTKKSASRAAMDVKRRREARKRRSNMALGGIEGKKLCGGNFACNFLKREEEE